MAKKQGKINSRLFPAKMDGTRMVNQQVLIGRRIGKVASYVPNTNLYTVHFYDGTVDTQVRFPSMFRLMLDYVTTGDLPMTITMTVKWSQWQAAIDSKEVDSEQEVTFEEADTHTTSGIVTMARIIPIKKRQFTTDDVDAIMDEVWDLAAKFGADLSVPEANDALSELKLRYA